MQYVFGVNVKCQENYNETIGGEMPVCHVGDKQNS